MLRAVAENRATIAKQSLVVAVVRTYATLFATEGTRKVSEETLRAAGLFLAITQESEANREVAHGDVLRVQIQEDDRRPALNNAELALDETRVALALPIFR